MPIRIDAPEQDLRRTLVDGPTQAVVTFVCRRPSNAEQLEFDRKLAKGKAKAVGERLRSLSAKMVQPLIRGIEFPDPDKALAYDQDGQLVILSSRPGDPGYREDWLAVVAAFSPGLIRLLGMKLFAGEGEEDPEEEAPNS